MPHHNATAIIERTTDVFIGFQVRYLYRVNFPALVINKYYLGCVLLGIPGTGQLSLRLSNRPIANLSLSSQKIPRKFINSSLVLSKLLVARQIMNNLLLQQMLADAYAVEKYLIRSM